MRLLRRVRRFARSLIFYSLAMFLAVLFVGAFALYAIEHGHNPGIRSYFDAVWLVMETITTVGYGDVVPATFWGRVADMVIMPLGIAVISMLTASIATELTNAAINRALGRHSSSRSGHIVVVGGVGRALAVIGEILKAMEREGVLGDVTYIYEGDRPPSLPKDVEFVRGDPFNPGDLLRAGVDRASAVVITPFEGEDPASSDAKVVFLAMSARRLNGDAYIIAEVLREVDVEYAVKAGANSVVSLGSFTTALIAEEVFSRGISRALAELIRGGRVEVVSGEGFAGAKFADVVNRLKAERNYLVIGVVRGGEPVVNPSGDFAIQPGDSLLVIK
jgi:voltage-gated potassium channel